MEIEHQAALLKEYEICDGQVNRLDSLIWQVASVIFPISLAGFAYFGLTTDHTPEQFLSALSVGIGSVTLIVGWFLLSRAWYSYQSIAFYRMREIESELGLWHYRYSLYARQTRIGRDRLAERSTDDEKARFKSLELRSDKFTRIGLRATTAAITLIFLAGWIALIIREYFLTY